MNSVVDDIEHKAGFLREWAQLEEMIILVDIPGPTALILMLMIEKALKLPHPEGPDADRLRELMGRLRDNLKVVPSVLKLTREETDMT